ncbi:tRNA (adenosine(37)-N6)-threonylcarbamoyltransferase complex dimerization subunit type 1 TsaB [Acetobacter lambici]|uniref:tRNA (Adenosine(37)-N6)-threonylcarbamoyltransferase complex dimerization subunit type 1 TsaB n=1 Tax=Acetobacter lambici TaxID=1332824 RepID=A0ABT1EYW7_9PROT|nr:tRNA (adenosine(37)-N6)-threonylcarbamoyltransferase complex dimerization subunit type 1 TsaB [Acetobacter lambici]MCP1257941.1 tRNA (adenosine(37)-N6)-threonylcarbamoyltransferase complex dimerization subunit type 1 TsaB [Acetobacter lambici]NHO56300.1 tRNA (adenosine(37)-N6)-threonylcarbamoyltransferase complex dimerization subunit type 1 TsaB [Acetobacter lambici]
MVQRILVIDGSPAGDNACGTAACVASTDGQLQVVACMQEAGKQAAEGVSLLAAKVLQQAGWSRAQGTAPDLVVVVVGPGSFTGLRASCAAAAGYAVGVGCPVVGVTRAEALAPELDAALAAQPEPMAGWLVVTAARRGRVFVEGRQGVQAATIADWSAPKGTWLVAGESRAELAFPSAVLCPLTHPDVMQITAAALRRVSGALPARAALPVYVDPPEAKLPANGLRAAPV